MYVVASPSSVDQRMEALERANRIRTARARWKRDVKAGRVNPVLMLARPASEFESMQVPDFLRAIPHFGPTTVQQMLKITAIPSYKTLGELTERQRSMLLAQVHG